MKLDNVKNVLIYQKALYTEQLHYYTKLCELYSNLSKFHKSFSNPNDLETFYAKPLSLAVSGNLNFDEIGEFSRREQKVFKKYSFYSQKFNELNKASESLNDVLVYENEAIIPTNINNENLEKFVNFMNTYSKETEKFNSNIEKKSKNKIAINISRSLKSSGKAIDKIDKNHLSEDQKNKLDEFSAKKCGFDVSKISTIKSNNTDTKYQANSTYNLTKVLSIAINSKKSN